MKREDILITVCAGCERACCWQGEFMCDAAARAGIKYLTIGELNKKNKESSDYWEKDPQYLMQFTRVTEL